MGHCCSKDAVVDSVVKDDNNAGSTVPNRPRSPRPSAVVANGTNGRSSSNTPTHSFTGSPWQSTYPAGVPPTPSPARTPRRMFKWPFPPPSPAKPIMSAILTRQGKGKGKGNTTPTGTGTGTIPEDEGGDGERALDKSFGYQRNFGSKYELGKEVGRGHFGHTCWAKGKKGALKNQPVAVKIISKAKMTTAISIEDVRREVKLLKGLCGHQHMVQFHDAFEDDQNVYIVMELCEGGELLDRILSRGGRYTENDAKSIIVQILSVASFCHLQGVVHRDLKPENFLFSTKNEDSPLKVIDFDQRLNDIVGSAYYVAPEVLHRSYNVEADIWSIGVITYILLCGSRPFFARTESGIFRSVLRADPNLNDSPWPSISPEAKDFVKRLLNKDHRKRMTASQALTHPWLLDENRAVPLDILIYKLALSKALTEDELVYLRAQFDLLEPKDGCVSLDNFRTALVKNSTAAMKESRVLDILDTMKPLSYTRLTFEEFCAAAISPHQLEALEGWETIASTAFEYFELEGNRVISVDALAQDWIRGTDGKLNFLGYAKLLHGLTIRSSNTRHH
ncbi:EF-hand-like domain-containing protein [Cynara cardunculus var. scolymus]|uniref:non-specific serine/threonine protein kinase n=1 Tax=Cynara cardunculus var. scolymus TaxID=59895 RepID=A0A103Y8R7_CYNCS|nr:EF-hand-like domain-containing protein [Cynara cardunculus var. scolymus]